MSKRRIHPATIAILCLFGFVATVSAETKLRIRNKAFGEYAPKELIGAAAVLDSKHDRMVVFGREHGEHPVLLALDLEKETWTRLKTTGAEPEGTGVPGMAYVASEDAAYVFGGWAPGERLPKAELWRIDLSATAPFEWKLLKPKGETPPGRNGMVFVFDEPGGRLLLHGGDKGPNSQYSYTPLDDLWSYDLKSKTWAQLKPTGDGPTPRWNHAGAIDAPGGKLHLFGGGGYVLGDNPQTIIDTFVFTLDLSTLVWTKSAELERVPRPVQGTSLTFDEKAGALLLVGGMTMDQKGTPGVERIYCYDLADGKWTRTKEVLFEKRRDHVGIYDAKRNRHIIYGGHTVVNNNYYRIGDSLGDSFVVTVQRGKSD